MLLSQDAAQQWNGLTASRLLGVGLASGSSAAGEALPPTTAAYGDRQQLPWHPDSPTFWLIAIAGATVLGLAGIEVRGRVGKGRAGANIGNV